MNQPAADMRRLPALCLLLLLAACRPGEHASAPGASAPATLDVAAQAGAPHEAAASPQEARAPGAAAPGARAERRMRTGTVSVAVREAGAARANLIRHTRALGGYVGDETTEADLHRGPSVTLTLRVPDARFDALLDTLAALGSIQHRHVATADVTAAYVDLAARLRTREAVEARYRDLLARARTVDEVLTVERALQGVREEIESARGQLALWDHQAAYATLTVSLVPPAGATRPGFPVQAWEAVRAGASFLEAAILDLITLWPLALVALGLLAAWRRHRRPRRAPAPV